MEGRNMDPIETVNFCTLFDSNYLSRGLAMFESLKQHCVRARLFVLAMDNETESVLLEMCLDRMAVVPMASFEDESLLSVKADRSRAEYCWTCTPAFIDYCLKAFKLESCTYVDADLFFFSDPEALIREMGDQSILLTEHRYTPQYDQSDTSGIYCVQFMTFQNTEAGRTALTWWRSACLNWCFARFEDGKFGDQKYLDDWPARFKGVHVMNHPGGGIAPWNVQQYELECQSGALVVKFMGRAESVEAVFYHFHDLRFVSGDSVDLGSYRLNRAAVRFIYVPYVRALLKQGHRLNAFRPGKGFHGASLSKNRMTISPDAGFPEKLWFVVKRVLYPIFIPIKRRWRCAYNIHSIRHLLED